MGFPHLLRKAKDQRRRTKDEGLFRPSSFVLRRKMLRLLRQRPLQLITAIVMVLAAGAIGEVRMLQVDFGFRTSFNPQGSLFDPALGGGALLDVGIYPVSLASMIFGTPERVTGMAHLGETGVDEQSAMIFGYAGGQLALLSQAIRTNSPHEALLLGTVGKIRVHSSWWKATTITLSVDGRPDELIDLPEVGNGYNYEAAEVGRCLRAGRTESNVMPLDETLAIMRTLDEVRAQWGLRYPGE